MYTEESTCTANVIKVIEKMGFFSKFGLILYPLLNLIQTVPVWVKIHDMLARGKQVFVYVSINECKTYLKRCREIEYSFR